MWEMCAKPECGQLDERNAAARNHRHERADKDCASAAAPMLG
jgi:hypothetical protein